MEIKVGTVVGSSPIGRQSDDTGLESLQFCEEIQGLMTIPAENASSFTALLELPATQALELLHSPDSGGGATAAVVNDDSFQHCIKDVPKPYFSAFNCNLTFPTNSALIERAAKLSVLAEEHSPETTSSVLLNSSVNLEKVKNEPTTETDSNPNPLQTLISDPTVENTNQRSAKRKEREKKGKGSTKKSKNESNEDAEKLPYVHVRARRGQATDSHSLAERARREKINARMKLLQELVPGCNKISGTALVLDEIINHVQSLQRQVEFLSMRLAAVNPRVDFNIDSILAAENEPVLESSFPTMVTPLMWPEIPVSGTRQQYQPQWHFDGSVNQQAWARDEHNHHNFSTPENSLLSYDSSANSASLHSNQLKMEL